jgi:pilus assembly protein CpaC
MYKRTNFLVASCALIGSHLANTTYVAAQTPPPSRNSAANHWASLARGGDAMHQRLSMGVGKSVIVDLPRDASEIFVGNPAVANAVVRSARKLYVIGMANGQTTIFAMDAAGAQIAKIDINIGRDVGELQRILSAAIPDSNIVARTVEEAIILTGEVPTAGDAQNAMDIAAGVLKVDGAGDGAAGGGATVGRRVNSLVVRGRDQVMLKVTITEVQRQVLKQLGVSRIGASGGWGVLNIENSFGSPPPSSLALKGVNKLDVTLQAFERYGVARVLAEPTVTAVSGESAKFMAGGEVPVSGGVSCTQNQAGQQSCAPSVNFKPYGISLNFTPVVLAEGRILLRVATEVTEVDSTQSLSIGNGASVPGFRTRRNETSVELPSGGSIVSAGLIQVRSTQAITGVPGLMNLPILGAAFRSRNFQREESELLVIVTPYIAKPSSPSQIARPDDGFAEASDPQGWFLGRVNQIYATRDNAQAVQRLRGRYGFILD